MKKGLLLLFLITSFNTQAYFLFEPSLGYGKGTFFNNNNREDGNFTNLSFGTRLAYVDDTFLLGVDVRAMSQDYEKNYVDNIADDYLAMDIGWVLGIHAGSMRFWYSFGTTGMQMEQGSDGFYYGNFDKWGVSYRYTSNLFFNVEIVRQYYDEYEIQNTPTRDLSGDLENRTVLFSVSFPFIF